MDKKEIVKLYVKNPGKGRNGVLVEILGFYGSMVKFKTMREKESGIVGTKEDTFYVQADTIKQMKVQK